MTEASHVVPSPIAGELESVIRIKRISHVGIVVENCETAAAWWTRMFGIPFSIVTSTLDERCEFKLRGQPSNWKIKVAISPQGHPDRADFAFLELLEVIEGDSPHGDFLRTRGEGLQHLAFTVDDLDTDLRRLADEGIMPVLEYRFQATIEGKEYFVKEAYLDSGEISGSGATTVQLLEFQPTR